MEKSRPVKLEGKIAIVTGTSPNIGAGIGGGLADEGAKVVCVDVVADNAAQCADWIKRRGGDAPGITCDTTDEAQVEAMMARVRDAYGGVDVLVNNAGILGGLSVLEMPLDRWNRQLAVNLTGTPTATDVSESHDRSVEWGRPRPERRGRLLDFQKMVPTGQLPSPRHCARASVFLASDDAEMITAFDLRVDAGHRQVLTVGAAGLRGGDDSTTREKPPGSTAEGLLLSRPMTIVIDSIAWCPPSEVTEWSRVDTDLRVDGARSIPSLPSRR